MEVAEASKINDRMCKFYKRISWKRGILNE